MKHIICQCIFKSLTRSKSRLWGFLVVLLVSSILCLNIHRFIVKKAGKEQIQGHISRYLNNASRKAHDFNQLNVTPSSSKNIRSCVLPYLPLWSPEMEEHVRNPPTIECSKDNDWVFTQRGRFFISAEASKKHGKIQCVYIPIVNNNDSFRELKPIFPKNGSALVSDAFNVTCKAANGKRYTNIHACINPRSNNLKASKSEGFNILILGLDSLSRQMFKRLLPKTHSYFSETLGGKILEGYNIIGDGTPQALMPILTGQQETEIPEVRRGKPGARHVDDVLTFFWTRCEKKGYVTQWGEDSPQDATFNLRMLGFRKQPVHHYMRPFQLAAITAYPRFRDNCLGSRPRYKVFLDWLKEGLITNKNKTFFTFGFFSELSHNNNTPVAIMDDAYVDLLEFMNSQSILDNTVLILMSDHGLRYGPLRSTEQGKLEERLPYFGFRFPKKFELKHPLKVKTFDINTKRLVTPFDIHETLLDIIGDRGKRVQAKKTKGMSLFEKVPVNRTCASAGIAPHWCACLKQTVVPVTDIKIVMSVNAVINTINEMLEPFEKKCYTLTLKHITKAMTLETNDDVLKFRKTVDADGRIPLMNDTLEVKLEIHQVAFVTEPNNGMFEATVRVDIESGDAYINVNDISRINKYGDDPWCILGPAPRLRPYCVCKESPSLVQN